MIRILCTTYATLQCDSYKALKRREEFRGRVQPRDQWQGAYPDQLGQCRATAEHGDAAVNGVLRFKPVQKTLEMR